MPTTPSNHAIPWRSRPIAWLPILLTTVLLASPSDARSGLVAKLGAADLGELSVGDDLWVDWPDAPLDATLDVRLVDAAGYVVASRTVETGPKGWDEPLILWPVTGVTGCDAETPEGLYRFRNFEEALTHLLGETLQIEVAGYPVGFHVRLTRPTQVIYYFSDMAGCPRATFARSETQYLSAWAAHGGNVPTQLTLFLGREGCPKHVEVRGEPMAFDVPPTSRQATREIGSACDLGCDGFTGWVRPSHEAGCVDLEGDPCGSTYCTDSKADVAVYAIGADAIARYIQSKGRANADYDDGQCDLCDDVDPGNGG